MKKSKHYDERQLLYRYKGFTLGFIVLCILIFINLFLPDFGIHLFANEKASGLTIIFIATTITICYQALNDAHASKRENLLSSAIFTSLISVITGFNFFSSLISGQSDLLNQSGQIENPIIALTFILWLPISLISIFKYYRSRK